MSFQSETRAWVVASAAAFCLGAIGYSTLKLPDLAPTLARANTALDTINHPCAPGPCGTLANVDKLVVKVGDIAVDTQRQVRQSGTLINAASQSLTSTSQHLDAAIGTANVQLTHIAPLLDAVRGAADAIPGTLKHVNDAADGVTPILANADGAVSDFRRFLTAPALNATLSNVDALTAAWARISTNGAKITDKMTADYFKPTPWYLYPIKKGSELLDIGAAVARHTP
jgi:hypothetical protein